METSSDFNNFVKNKDEDSFIDMVKKTWEYFWRKNTDAWQKYTDKITYLISKQTKKIKNNIWKKVEFENIYSWDIINVKIINFDYKNVFLEDKTKLDISEREIL
jgi:dissimilatory sulfite reductase (desulfoviridin) alpha/beta subunit